MPRKPRIDAPGYLYHVIARGIERREIFADNHDHEVFQNRLGKVIRESETPLYAFAHMPNHVHLLLRRTEVPISRVMQRLLTSYAIYFNKRYERSGHLFQNRYKSIICDEEKYFLELVRYINLNPLRAGLVDSMKDLSRYRYCSHRLIMGDGRKEWFDPDAVLACFGSRIAAARRAYYRFVEAGTVQGSRDDLEGGGLNRSLRYIENESADKEEFDNRVLGLGDFIRQLNIDQRRRSIDCDEEALGIVDTICREYSVSVAELLGGSRRKKISAARAHVAKELQQKLGLSISEISKHLFVTRRAVAKMIEKDSMDSREGARKYR